MSEHTLEPAARAFAVAASKPPFPPELGADGAHNDVLRDEGETHARKLTETGVRTISVRFNGIVGDFMTINQFRGAAAADAAIELAINTLGKAFAR